MGLDSDRIYQGDCLELFGQVEAESIDLAFADPPFNIGYDYDVYDDRKGADEYLAWSKRWIEGVVRVLKPDGTFWLAIGDEFAAELKVLCTRELGLHLRNWVVWFYTFGVHCKHKFTRSHAHLFYFVKNPKKFTFNSPDVRVPSARELVYGDKRADPKGRVPDDTWMMTPILPPDVPTRDGFILRPQDIPARFPQHSDTWFYSRVAGTFNERRGWHGCQMPEQLLGRIIRACSKKGQVVLDPFAGSGTTPAVAKKLEREYIAFELSRKYAKKAEQRLASVRAGEALTGPADATLSAPKTSAGRRLKRSASPSHKPVSRSPVLARANLSLGQVAVASGELFTAVAEAFMASHQGYSVDRVVAEPALNDKFLDNCRLLGIPGFEKDWNHRLLGLRKKGSLAGIDTSRRTTITRAAMAPFINASEMAWQKVGKRLSYSLDDILCDPTAAEDFDRVARRIAPGHSSLEYRWAALSLRKFVAKGDGIAAKIDTGLATHPIRLSDPLRLPETPGHYLIKVGDSPFFAGFANSFRACPLFDFEKIRRALDEMGVKAFKDSEIHVRTRQSDWVRVQQQIVGTMKIAWAAACRRRLVEAYRPAANILPSKSGT